MKNKTCGECKWFNKIIGIHCTWHEIEMHPNEEACGDFEPPSVFDHITQSEEVLAEKFVIKQCNSFGGSSYKAILLVDENGNYRDFYSREKAVAATIEEFKKEWKR